jgi:probable HAF family extracellular repeat protein
VAGIFYTPENAFEAFHWPVGESFTPLGDLPGGGFAYPLSRAFDISADGNTIVGNAQSAAGNEAYRWTRQTGMRSLGDFVGGDVNSQAHGVSADGSVIVGYGTGAFNHPQAAVWINLSPPQVLPMPTGVLRSQANAVSADGSLAVGFMEFGVSSGTVTHAEAFRWSAGSPVISLGDLPGASRYSVAHDVSADGSVIVGASDTLRDDGFDTRAAFYWTAESGMVNLRDLLVSHGATNLSGWRLSEARGVSADGLTVVGTGLHDGRIEAFIATIPEPSTIVLALLAAAASLFLALQKRPPNLACPHLRQPRQAVDLPCSGSQR